MLLFILGAATGVLLARGMTSLLLKLLPAFPQPVGVSLPLDVRVVLFTAALSLLAALFSGLAPAFHLSKSDIVMALKNVSNELPGPLSIRKAFVVGQVAFSLLLIVAAGLLIRAEQRVAYADMGFDPKGVETVDLDLSVSGYTSTTGPIFARQLLDRVRELPGVQAATLADQVPVPGRIHGTFGEGLAVPGVDPPNGAPYFMANWNIVESDYFDTLRIPIVAGRDFTITDTGTAPLVAIVTESTARKFWPGQSAIGQNVLWQVSRFDGSSTTRTLMVVGVVRDLKRDNGKSGDAQPLAIYVPLQQRYTPRISIFARAIHDQRIASAIRSLLSSLDPNLLVVNTQTLENQLNGPVELQLRIAASISGSLGVVGLLLAGIGVYGVTAYSVMQRTREIGIRVAMGASHGDVVRMILRQGMSFVLFGAAIGVALAAAASRLLRSLLFGLSPLDFMTFATAVVVFTIVGLVACYLPARRAARVDPLVALRYE
jgi:predicted permease